MEAASIGLVLYSAQILVVVSVAALASAVGSVSLPAVRLKYWRAVGLLCLSLPLLETTGRGVPVASVAFGPATLLPIESETYAPFLIPAGAYIFWIWVSGAVVRLGSLVVGACRLRGLRQRSSPAMLGADIEALIVRAPRAELHWSFDLAQPVTFGMRRPVILLPSRFADLGADAQRAVLYHELLHVARRDWVWIVLEESIRALFWFHPGVWWLVEQVQLAREQVIDQLVVAGTKSRHAYMDALMTFADSPSSAVLSITFLRRRHLKSRFQQLSKEPHMSFQRLAWTMAALLVAMSGAAIGTAWALPFDIRALSMQSNEITRAPGASEARGDTAVSTPASESETSSHQADVVDSHDADVSWPVVVSSVRPSYTPAALEAKIEGQALLSAVVLTDGTVGEVTVTESLDRVYGLDDEAVKAVKQWRFKAGTKKGSPVAVRVDVEIRFTLK
jgi:TonB family protein